MIALWLLVGALAVLIALHGEVILALAFAVVFGCSNGVVTIVRGTVPAELFGRAGYGVARWAVSRRRRCSRARSRRSPSPLWRCRRRRRLDGCSCLTVMAVLSVASFSIAVKKR